ncbi:hypothetical protein LuPra_02429 [Luteitalea pratensis]|uniref:Uncharacterized protein n=1 Tax=Luteitalea pratensis TaxID=1855912 RepID=A0A143PLD2_LUTPR|nr:hypothetical protein LuPra_02429 [Luteitalea pratensis]
MTTTVTRSRQLQPADFVCTLRSDSRRASPSRRGAAVTDAVRVSRSSTLTRALCVVVLLGMAVAVAFSAWIAILNFSRIGV